MKNDIRQIYIDGVDNINFINGMVRISMGTIIPPQNNKNENQEENTFKPEYCIIMPLNSFLLAFKSQEGLINKLIENKIISTESPEGIKISEETEKKE